MMKKTPWKEFTERGQRYRIQATYGMDYAFGRRNGQAPYFSATATIERWERGRWSDDSSGMQHDEIEKHFPELGPYLKWHLVSTDAPTHYIANAKYWWEVMVDKRPPDQRVNAKDALKSTIVYGAVPGDDNRDLLIPWPNLQAWLETRLPKLMGYFAADMQTLGVLE